MNPCALPWNLLRAYVVWIQYVGAQVWCTLFCSIIQWKTCNSKQGMNLQPLDLFWNTYHILLHKNTVCLHSLNGVIHSVLLIQKFNACGIFCIHLESKLSSLSSISIIQKLSSLCKTRTHARTRAHTHTHTHTHMLFVSVLKLHVHLMKHTETRLCMTDTIQSVFCLWVTPTTDTPQFNSV
jgi:hypothetical protein